jgi:hypothetical protein
MGISTRLIGFRPAYFIKPFARKSAPSWESTWQSTLAPSRDDPIIGKYSSSCNIIDEFLNILKPGVDYSSLSAAPFAALPDPWDAPVSGCRLRVLGYTMRKGILMKNLRDSLYFFLVAAKLKRPRRDSR